MTARHLETLRRLACAAAACLLAAQPALATDPPPAADTKTNSSLTPDMPRPRIGLVLSGGGAQGGAHAGALEVLEELRVPVDCIAGTSVGAVIGGGYASGIPAKQLREFVLGIDWQSVVGGLGRRDLQPIEQKRAGVTYSNELEFGLRRGRITAPGGVVNTSDIDNLLRGYVARSRMQTEFDQLPIPFRAVATDMISGEMVVLDRGDLAMAMRASMAFPGIFAPVHTDEHVLADGGMVRNIPVDVVRELCAEIVIVVNLLRTEFSREQLQSAVKMLHRGMDVMIQANEQVQLRSLTEQDVLIEVPMGDIGVADFDRVQETVELGEQATRAAAVRLAALSLSPEQYRAWREGVTRPQQIETRIAEVRYEGLERVDPRFLEQRAQLRPGDLADTARIGREAQQMSALHEFESVEYRLDGDPQHPTLVWLPHEKPWGPHYLKFDLGMYTSEGGDLAFVVYGKHTRTWLNSRGGEWRNELQLGYENLLATSYYQPLDIAQRSFIEPRLLAERTIEDLFVNDRRRAKYHFAEYGGGLDLGVNLGTHAQARLGYLYTRRDTRVDTGVQLVPEVDADDAGLVFGATYDSRDTAFGPTRGVAAALEYRHSDGALGADRDWKRIELGLGMAVPLRNDVMWLTLAGGSELGSTLPLDRAFSIGGPGSFPGYELGELRSEAYWTASAGYNRKVFDILPISGQALYAGLRLQAGRAYSDFGLQDDDELYGASLYLTGRTPVGPLTVGVGATSTSSWSMWLAVGRPVGHGTILEKGIFR